VLNDEGARKFIHIGVANWWLLAMVVFAGEPFWMAAIPPATFIVLNYLSYRYHLVRAMERETKTTGDLGTVYYAISLFIIAFFAFYFDITRIGALAILIMGYGDGFAAIVGKAVNSTLLRPGKTVAGTVTMVTVSLIIGVVLFPPTAWVFIVLIALAAGLVELLTPRGFDNVTVPFAVFMMGVLLL